MDYNITYRQKDKGWQVIISYKDEDGKWKQKSKQGFKTKKDAKPFADKLIDELKEKISLPIPKEFDGITFEDFYKLHKSHIKLNLAHNTTIGYETALKHFRVIFNMKLSEIKQIHIQKCVDEMIKKGLKTNTIKIYLHNLRMIFNAAIDQYNLILNNPTKNIRIKNDKDINPKKALNKFEEMQLLKSISNPKYHLITLISLKCGLRIGEIIGLTWNDIDFTNNTIKVNKQWKVITEDGDYGLGSVKSKNSNRIVPMPSILKTELICFKNNNPRQIDGRIFSYKNTASIAGDLLKDYKKLGFNISVHELRHTYATNLIANGVDFKTAAQLLGHDIEQTLKTYSHVNDDMFKRAVDIINSCL